MKNVFEVQGLRIVFEFVNEHLIHRIKVKNTLTGRNYSGKSIELTRMRRDTIIAAFSKDNSQSISYKFKEIYEDNALYLNLNFEVKFDYLPSFEEAINLEEVQDKHTLPDVTAQIDELTSVIDNFEKQKQNNLTYSENCWRNIGSDLFQITKKQVQQGNYLVSIMGACRPNGQAKQETIVYEIIKPNKQKIKHTQKSMFYQGIGAPFSLTTIVEVENDGQMIIRMGSNKYNISFNLQSYYVTITPLYN